MKFLTKSLINITQMTASILSNAPAALLISVPTIYSATEMTHQYQWIQTQSIEISQRSINESANSNAKILESMRSYSDANDFALYANQNLYTLNISSRTIASVDLAGPMQNINIPSSSATVMANAPAMSQSMYNSINSQFARPSQMNSAKGSSSKTSFSPSTSHIVANSNLTSTNPALDPNVSKVVAPASTSASSAKVSSSSSSSSTSGNTTSNPSATIYSSTQGICYADKGNGKTPLDIEILLNTSQVLINPIAASIMNTDGDIYILGSKGTNWLVQKIRSDGSSDNSWGSGSVLTLSSQNPGQLGAVASIALDSSGRVLVTGTSSGTNQNFVVVRLNTDSTVDTSFGINGFASIDFNKKNDAGYFSQVLSSGVILTAGQIKTPPASAVPFTLGISQLGSTGNLQTNFATNGITSSDINNLSADFDNSVDILEVSQNEIYISTVSSNGELSIVKMNSLGALNPAFGTAGILKYQDQPLANQAIALEQISSSKVVVMKYSTSSGGYQPLVEFNIASGATNSSNLSANSGHFCRIGRAIK